MKRILSIITLIFIVCSSAFAQTNTELLGLEIDLDNAEFYGTPGLVYASYENHYNEMKASFSKYFAYGFNSRAKDFKNMKNVLSLDANTNRIVKINNIQIDNDGDLTVSANIISKNSSAESKPAKVTADGDSEQGELYVIYDKNTMSQFMFHLYLAAYTLGVNTRKALIK